MAVRFVDVSDITVGDSRGHQFVFFILRPSLSMRKNTQDRSPKSEGCPSVLEILVDAAPHQSHFLGGWSNLDARSRRNLKLRYQVKVKTYPAEIGAPIPAYSMSGAFSTNSGG